LVLNKISVTTCFYSTKGDKVDLRRAFLCMFLFSLAPHHPTNKSTLYSSIIDLEVCVRSYISLNIWPSGKSPNRNQPTMKEDTIIFLQDKWNFQKDVLIFERFFVGTFGNILKRTFCR
jgi:hypothetical protein